MKLDSLLQKMEGDAGEFVYDQLPSRVREDYKLLTSELAKRFKTVENKDTFEARFDNRNKKASESIEQYVADLRKLYDKAHPNRNHKVREEDILKRLLNGLGDEKAAFHVQVVKNIKSVDKAVSEIINFQEVKKKRLRPKTRQAVVLDSPSSSSESEYERGDIEERIARAPGRPPKVDKEKDPKNVPSDTGVQETLQLMAEQLKDMKKAQEDIQKEKDNAVKKKEEQDQSSQSQNKTAPQRTFRGQGNQNRQRSDNNPLKWLCFNCFQRGHTSGFCNNPTAVLGHMQVVAGVQKPLQATQAASASVPLQQSVPSNWSGGYNMNQASVGATQLPSQGRSPLIDTG